MSLYSFSASLISSFITYDRSFLLLLLTCFIIFNRLAFFFVLLDSVIFGISNMTRRNYVILGRLVISSSTKEMAKECTKASAYFCPTLFLSFSISCTTFTASFLPAFLSALSAGFCPLVAYLIPFFSIRIGAKDHLHKSKRRGDNCTNGLTNTSKYFRNYIIKTFYNLILNKCMESAFSIFSIKGHSNSFSDTIQDRLSNILKRIPNGFSGIFNFILLRCLLKSIFC